MDNDNYVIFKGGKNGIIIWLNKDVNFDILKEQLRKKVADAQKFFDKSKSPITFKGRELSDEEERECINIIVSESNLNITYVYNEDIECYERDEDKKSEMVDFSVTPTKFCFGAIRSGQLIRFEGSVVIIGDVNPGAEIIADGNIMVIGTLKGVVHAGCKGRTDVFVAALRLIPVQLRIADIITYFPEEAIKSKNKVPEFAHIQDDRICVEPINCRT